MAAYKFYQQYALKTNDGEYYLENIEDRVWNNALYFGQGNEELAKQLAEEMITQRYQPATPSFLSAGRSRRGGWPHTRCTIHPTRHPVVCHRLRGAHGLHGVDVRLHAGYDG